MKIDRKNVEATRLYKDEQGVYNWVYILPMYRNFSILRTLVKGLAIGLLAAFLVPLFLLIRDGIIWRHILMLVGIYAIVYGVTFLLAVLCYFFVAWIYGGKYVAIYRMDEQMIAQYQPGDQAEKARMIGAASAAAGALGGNAGLMAAGMTQGRSAVVETKFTEIRSLKFFPDLNEVRVHSFLTWYSIYVHPADFSLIAEYMESRSVNARIVHR